MQDQKQEADKFIQNFIASQQTSKNFVETSEYMRLETELLHSAKEQDYPKIVSLGYEIYKRLNQRDDSEQYIKAFKQLPVYYIFRAVYERYLSVCQEAQKLGLTMVYSLNEEGKTLLDTWLKETFLFYYSNLGKELDFKFYPFLLGKEKDDTVKTIPCSAEVLSVLTIYNQAVFFIETEHKSALINSIINYEILFSLDLVNKITAADINQRALLAAMSSSIGSRLHLFFSNLSENEAREGLKYIYTHYGKNLFLLKPLAHLASEKNMLNELPHAFFRNLLQAYFYSDCSYRNCLTEKEIWQVSNIISEYCIIKINHLKELKAKEITPTIGVEIGELSLFLEILLSEGFLYWLNIPEITNNMKLKNISELADNLISAAPQYIKLLEKQIQQFIHKDADSTSKILLTSNIKLAIDLFDRYHTEENLPPYEHLAQFTDLMTQYHKELESIWKLLGPSMTFAIYNLTCFVNVTQTETFHSQIYCIESELHKLKQQVAEKDKKLQDKEAKEKKLKENYHASAKANMELKEANNHLKEECKRLTETQSSKLADAVSQITQLKEKTQTLQTTLRTLQKEGQKQSELIAKFTANDAKEKSTLQSFRQSLIELESKFKLEKETNAQLTRELSELRQNNMSLSQLVSCLQIESFHYHESLSLLKDENMHLLKSNHESKALIHRMQEAIFETKERNDAYNNSLYSQLTGTQNELAQLADRYNHLVDAYNQLTLPRSPFNFQPGFFQPAAPSIPPEPFPPPETNNPEL